MAGFDLPLGQLARPAPVELARLCPLARAMTLGR